VRAVSEGNIFNIDKLDRAYFIYGEDVYPALQFIEDIKSASSGRAQGEVVVEKYVLGTDKWADIIDSARTMPLLLSSIRLIAVDVPSRKRQNIPREEEKLSSNEEELLRAYLSSPSEKTVLFILFNQRIKGGSSLLKFFKSLPKDYIRIKELNSLKGRGISTWIRERVRSEGKEIDGYACSRLVELAGNDLRRLSNEISKLVTFAGEKTHISLEDVELVSGWIKPLIEWEIINSLEEADYQKCLLTLDKLIRKENIHPVIIMDKIHSFFNDILLAKLRIQEGNKDNISIFKEIKPHLPEKYRGLYQRKFKQVFRFAERVSIQDLRQYIEQLKDIDIKIKSTGLSFHELMDGFLFDYCRRRAGKERLF